MSIATWISNRRPAGNGHVDWKAVGQALRDVHFDSYVSAEALPYPNPDQAARDTIERYRWFIRGT